MSEDGVSGTVRTFMENWIEGKKPDDSGRALTDERFGGRLKVSRRVLCVCAVNVAGFFAVRVLMACPGLLYVSLFSCVCVCVCVCVCACVSLCVLHIHAYTHTYNTHAQDTLGYQRAVTPRSQSM